jgi:GNAT superfamily N-acetyltransferase
VKRRAAQNQVSGASRTFVACDDDRVIAYYALASGAVAAAAARGRFRRNMPDPIPVVILARLAETRSHQGCGLGRALFQDAARRVIHAADSIGIRGMLVHAISEEAKSFYLRLGLDVSPLEPM